MKYLSFDIYNYRAIEFAKVEVSNNLIPVIGINESGKTTALQAILAFDRNKDRYNKGAHLIYENKYIIKSEDKPQFKIVANILIENNEDLEFLSKKLNLTLADETYKKLNKFFTEQKIITLARIFDDSKRIYVVENGELLLSTKKHQTELADALYERLPLILYFDDFSDRVPESIEFSINLETQEISDGKKDDWQSIVEEIFKRGGGGITLGDFIKMNSADDKDGLLNDIQDTLDEEVIEDWKKLKQNAENLADESEDLRLKLQCRFSEDKTSVNFNFKVEDRTIKKGRMFNVTERSKGFQWFFNFIVKLKFNPKYQENQKGAIYLLDEPGSYLHTSAQEELLNKLKEISDTNTILYCTHSQYLLDPEIINIARIRIAKKDNGKIQVLPFSSAGTINGQGALTPLYQALHLKSGALNQRIDYPVITEGITDYYLFNMLKKHLNFFDEKISFIPGGGATHLRDLISQAIAFSKDYLVLLDSDKEGRDAYDTYKSFFGDLEIKKHFFKYQIPSQNENVQLEDHLSSDDTKRLSALTNTAGTKIAIPVLYYMDEISRLNFFNRLDSISLSRLEIIKNKVNKLISQ